MSKTDLIYFMVFNIWVVSIAITFVLNICYALFIRGQKEDESTTTFYYMVFISTIILGLLGPLGIGYLVVAIYGNILRYIAELKEEVYDKFKLKDF